MPPSVISWCFESHHDPVVMSTMETLVWILDCRCWSAHQSDKPSSEPLCLITEKHHRSISCRVRRARWKPAPLTSAMGFWNHTCRKELNVFLTNMSPFVRMVARMHHLCHICSHAALAQSLPGRRTCCEGRTVFWIWHRSINGSYWGHALLPAPVEIRFPSLDVHLQVSEQPVGGVLDIITSTYNLKHSTCVSLYPC